MKQKLFACERCCAIRRDSDNDLPKDLFFTRHSLLTHSQKEEKLFKPNSGPGNRVYCDKKKTFLQDVILLKHKNQQKNY